MRPNIKADEESIKVAIGLTISKKAMTPSKMKISSITNMNEVRLRLSSSNSGIKFLDSSEEFFFEMYL